MIIGIVAGSAYQTLTRFLALFIDKSFSIFAGLTGALIGGLVIVLAIPSYGVVGAAISYAIVQSVIGFVIVLCFVWQAEISIRQVIWYDIKDFKFTEE